MYRYLTSKGRILPSQRGEAAISQRYTVHEAALLLGMSADAVRKRAARGHLNKEKAPDGTMYIRLDTNQTATRQSATSNETAISPTELIDGLWSYIESLKSELAVRNEELRRWEEEHREESRRKDHLLAAAYEGMPKLETPSSEPPSPMAARGPHAGVRRTWWLRLLGG